MKINIYIIYKTKDIALESQYIKFAKNLGVSVAVRHIFDKNIKAAQKSDSKIAKSSYSAAFERYLDDKSVLLDSGGSIYDSKGFSEMLERYLTIGGVNFFIAGAYGFEEAMLKRYPSLSLSRLTFSHEIAKIVLLEQIYRGVSIMRNHPYHKI